MAVVYFTYFTLVRFLRACLADLSGLAELIALILALRATKEAEVLLAGEESGFVDFLRPLALHSGILQGSCRCCS